MSEQPNVITDVPEQKSRFSRLKAPAVKATAILAVVGLGAYALGRKTANDSCPCDTSDTETAGQTDPV
jgi:hypothetical protein